ncbi:MAG TPA: cobalamin-dependent protein [Coriobacteriia bacterium]|nr:cobalamin-dependent protein [Coriobacteriia bacterium]
MTDAIRALHTILTERIAARDRAGAVTAALDAVRSGGLSVPDLYDLLAALLVNIGASWQAGETEVWQEHYATAVVRTIIEACQPLVAECAPAPIGRSVVLATPSEEYHDLGLRMIADRFTLAGWTAHLLGASVPAAELLDAVRELGADAAVLSAYTHFHRLALKTYVDELHAAHPGLCIWVGGAAFAREHDGWPDEMMLDPHAIPALADGMV